MPTEAEEEPRRGFWSWLPRAGGLLGEDPGSIAWERGALAAALILLPLVVFFQQFTLGLRNQTLSTAPASVRNRETIDDPGIASMTVNSKLSVKILHKLRRLAGREGAGDITTEADYQKEVLNLETMAVTRTERVRMAMVLGELLGKAAAIERLDTLAKEVEPGGGLAMDIDWLRKIYRNGRDSVSDDVRKSLVDRHGWFGQLAVTHGALDSDPLRWRAVSGGERIIAFVVAYFIFFVILLGLAGFVAAIIVLVRYMSGATESRMDPPEKGGSVYLETYAVFLAGFLLLLMLSLVMFGFGVEASGGSLMLQEAFLWLLVLVPLWPIARGVEWRRTLTDLGWHRGAGVGIEVLCGIGGFLAARLLWYAGHWIGIGVDAIRGVGVEEAPGGYPLFEEPSASWTLLVVGAMSSVLWAPVVEETIMRGALYRHLRSRWRIVWSVLLTAALFGIVHPYSTSGMIEVAFGGIAFALMREWRGCLIAPVVAHALHNGSLEVLQLGLVSVAN